MAEVDQDAGDEPCFRHTQRETNPIELMRV